MKACPATAVMAVVIAHPDHLDAERIRALVSAELDLEVVGSARRRDDATDLLRAFCPDVAIIDINLLSFTDHPLHGWGPISREIRLVAVGQAEDPWVWSRLRAAGFAAYVPAARIDDELCEVLRGAVEPERTSASRSLLA